MGIRNGENAVVVHYLWEIETNPHIRGKRMLRVLLYITYERLKPINAVMMTSLGP